MDTTTDDNFFIEEPQKLTNSFFNKDKTIQMVELLAQKHHDNTNKKMQLNRNQCRLTYNKKLQQQPIQQQQLQMHTTMPQSFITRLEILCQATYDTNDISVANRAVDTLVSASKSGCCFLERYMVMLLNFCTKKQPLSETMKIKVDELLKRVLNVEFDRQQLIENLRRPEYKLTSVEYVIQLLRGVRNMLDYREQTAVNWLFVILDAFFVELATTDEAADIVEQISAHIDFQCALLRETESSKCLLKSILEHLHNETNSGSTSGPLAGQADSHSCNIIQSRQVLRPYYTIEQIEF